MATHKLKAKRTTHNAVLTVPVYQHVPNAGRQIWAVAFMPNGYMVCSPDLPGLREDAVINPKTPANNNTRFRVVCG